MRPHARLLLLCALAVLALPAPAPAQSTAPPGNAGIDEYVETVPSATGNRATRDGNKGGGALTPAQRKALEALGEDGRVLAETVEATAPAKSRTTSGGGRDADPGASAPATVPPRASGGSPVEAVVEAASGGASGGMGLLLPIILGATAALAVAVAVGRRRASR